MSSQIVPYEEKVALSDAFAKSGLLGIKTKEQAIVLMAICEAQGLHPATAAMNYHIIQGRPAKKSEAMLSDFISAGGSVKWNKLDDTIADATFSHPQGGEVRLTWDIERAKKAGLTEKDGSMYRKYPRQMLRSRLISEGVRTIYPAATSGMLVKEEFDETEDTERQVKLNTKKSRLENVIEAQMSEVEHPTSAIEHTPEPVAVPEPEPVKEAPPAAKTTAKAAKKDGVKTVTGVIEEQPKTSTVTNPKTSNAEVKYAFKIGDKYYGTFDIPLVGEIMKVVDLQQSRRKKNEKMDILIRFGFTERKSADGQKTFNDIVTFEQITAQDLPI